MSPPAPNRKQKNRHSKFPCLIIRGLMLHGIILLDRIQTLYTAASIIITYSSAAPLTAHIYKPGRNIIYKNNPTSAYRRVHKSYRCATHSRHPATELYRERCLIIYHPIWMEILQPFSLFIFLPLWLFLYSRLR